MLKNVHFQFDFQDEWHLNPNCLFYVLFLGLKCLLFQFLNSGIRMYISILAVVRNGRISRRKNSYILLKHVLLEFNFQDEGHLDANVKIVILTIYCKCLFSQFFSCCMCMDIPILTIEPCWAHVRISHQKTAIFC